MWILSEVVGFCCYREGGCRGRGVVMGAGILDWVYGFMDYFHVSRFSVRLTDF